MVRFTGEYLAGMMVGLGVGLFFLGLAIQTELVTPSNLKTIGFVGAGAVLVLAGGAWKLRLQGKGSP
jgi:hypothetical protein